MNQTAFNFIVFFLLLTSWTFAQVDSLAQTEADLYESIMDVNVDLEEAMEIMAKDYPELLKPVVEASKDYDRATSVQNGNETGQYYRELGQRSLQQKNYEKAVIYLKKSVEKTKKELGGIEKHPKLSRTYKDLGNALEGKKEVDEALIIYQRGLSSNATDFDDSDLLANPLAEDIISPTLAIPIFEAKGNLLLRSNKDENKLLAALMAYERAIELLDAICKKYRSEYAKLQLRDKVTNMSEKAIDAALQLYKLTRDKKYKNKLFTIAEKGKGMALMSAVLDSKANSLNSIPTDILERQQALKITLANLKQRLKKQPTDKVEKQIFSATQALYFLQDSLKIYYPEHEYAKLATNSLATDSLQAFLSEKNAAIVEYFIGKSSAYVFVITAEKLYIETLEDVDQIEDRVLALRTEIQSLNFKKDAEQSFREFTRNASVLYSLTLESPLERIDDTIDELIIIPDGALWLIPFELLLYDQAASAAVDFGIDNMSYLLTKYAVTYAHSSSLLLNGNKPTQASLPFIGFAPEFGGTEIAARSCFDENASMPQLEYNQTELDAVSSHYTGEIFLGNQATSNAFKAQVSEAELIHLSTHACMNKDNPMDSRIFFANQNYVTTEEIYDLNIKAKMAVLSACQTGIGKVYNGEGMISLARAFAYAGCPSVTMSLWSVADAATADIMAIYYDYLQSGHSKSKALQAAKIDYIKAQPKSKQHPYYWAAFVHVGDFSSLENSGFTFNKFWLFSVLGVGVLMIFLFGRKK